MNRNWYNQKANPALPPVLTLLLGRFFLIRSDHNSLVWLTRFKHLEGQLARFLEELSPYNYKLIHRRGTEHINTDAQSRIQGPLEEWDCYSAGQKLRDGFDVNLEIVGCSLMFVFGWTLRGLTNGFL